MTDKKIPRICSIENCDKRHKARGFCNNHYTQFFTSDLFEIKPRLTGCSVDGCGNPFWSSTFCSKHYKKWRKYGDPLFIKQKRHQCKIEECYKDVTGDGYCNRHYNAFKKYGNPLEWRHIMGIGTTAEERLFNALVKNPDGCWHWKGRPSRRQYGQFTFQKVKYLAHKLSWEIANQQSVPNGLFVLHSCDMASCANPEHLRIGTAKDNSQDAVERLRFSKGIQEKRVDATKEVVVRQIKRLLADNVPMRQIESITQIKYGNIWNIKHGKTFQWVT